MRTNLAPTVATFCLHDGAVRLSQNIHNNTLHNMTNMICMHKKSTKYHYKIISANRLL